MRPFAAVSMAGIVFIAALTLLWLHHHQRPSFEQTVRACLTNPAYIGANVEDDRTLLVQCFDDYEQAHR